MTQFNGKRLILVSAAMLALAGLVGCAKPAPEEATNEVEPDVVSSSNTAAPAPAVQVPVENAAENVAAVDPLPPEKPVPVDQQTLDDASATGMTSHVARDQDPGSSPAQ